MRRNLSRLKRALRMPSLTALAHDERVVGIAKTLVSYYYYLIPFAAFLYTSGALWPGQNFDPIWPVAWARYFGFEYTTAATIVSFVFVGTAFLGAFLHRHRWVRLLVFVGLWQAHALQCSFGSNTHQWYLWVYSSLLFVFLPNIWRNKDVETARRFLLYVWGAQALVALVYTMAGISKVMVAIAQYRLGEVHAFSVNAFAYQIAYFVPRLQEPAVLAPLIVAHPVVGWLPYIALIIMQVFSLWIIVRPSLQKAWALVTALFHCFTFYTMGISFYPQLMLVMLLFFNTPFAPERTTVRQFIRDLPIIGQIVERFDKVRGSGNKRDKQARNLI